MFVETIFFFFIFLCWGSFLNVLAYRLLKGESIVAPRSYCPRCKHPISWYDNIPVLSWILLRGKCRHCAGSISWLYPFIELLTACALTLLYVTVPAVYFGSYFVFISALIVTIRSDLETMLISRFVTIYLLPYALLCSMFGFLPITFAESVLGAGMSYLFLFLLAKIFTRVTGKEGIGQGDLELVALIGAFLGPLGAWSSLFVGSVLGLIGAIFFMLVFKMPFTAKIPFGPFLAFGAILYVFLQPYLGPLFLSL